MKKNKLIRLSLTVSRKEYITPHFIRIYLTGDNIQKLQNITPGANNKILIPPDGNNKIFFPELDYEKMRWKPQPKEKKPLIRTFTHRGIDIHNNEIWIDFVTHGDESPASAWAMQAQKGDVLGVLMKDGKTELYPSVKNYLLVSDFTGVPVLSAILEGLSEMATGTCIIEVYGPEDEHQIKTRAGIKFIWMHNKKPRRDSALVDVVRTIDLPAKDRFAYVAAEFSTIREIRSYLQKQNWSKEEIYAYSYWKSGKAENELQSERQKMRKN